MLPYKQLFIFFALWLFCLFGLSRFFFSLSLSWFCQQVVNFNPWYSAHRIESARTKTNCIPFISHNKSQSVTWVKKMYTVKINERTKKNIHSKAKSIQKNATSTSNNFRILLLETSEIKTANKLRNVLLLFLFLCCFCWFGIACEKRCVCMLVSVYFESVHACDTSSTTVLISFPLSRAKF